MSFVKIAGDLDVRRNMLACAIDVSGTEVPEYVVVGYKIESSSLEFNADVETGTDINGRDYSSVNNIQMSQSFEPHRLTGGELGKVGERLLTYVIDSKVEELSNFKCVIIYGFLEPEAGGEYVARMYDKCTIVPQSIGGDSWTDMPFEVHFGGDVTKGTANGLIDTIDFTPEV